MMGVARGSCIPSSGESRSQEFVKAGMLSFLSVFHPEASGILMGSLCLFIHPFIHSYVHCRHNVWLSHCQFWQCRPDVRPKSPPAGWWGPQWRGYLSQKGSLVPAYRGEHFRPTEMLMALHNAFKGLLTAVIRKLQGTSNNHHWVTVNTTLPARKYNLLAFVWAAERKGKLPRRGHLPESNIKSIVWF